MVMRRSRPLLLAVLVALTVGALVVGVSAAAAANGGNAANAKLCLKGGWRDLVTSDGAGFASEVDCVFYAARGGTPVTRYQYLQSQYQAICEQHNGLFFLNDEAGWGCRSSVGSLTQDSYDALSTPCQEAGGTPSGTASHGEYFAIYCDSIDRASPPAPGPGGGLPGLVRIQVTVALVPGVGPVELELSGLPAALGQPMIERNC
jgi:hypothetical protein